MFVLGGIGWLAWASAALGFWSGVLESPPLAGNVVRFELTGTALGCGIGFTAMALWMAWDSKVGKLRDREKLLNQIAWTGAERVLDVGCGRGLMLIGAAKHLTTGTATGIDLWQEEDLSGNRPEAALENAEREGVADRIEIRTEDMRQLSFPDATFDVVVSRAAIHNLYAADDRAKAVREIARVLKPGGQALIDDIRHEKEYRATFAANGCTEIRRLDSPVLALFVTLVTFGSLRPATLLVRKRTGN